MPAQSGAFGGDQGWDRDPEPEVAVGDDWPEARAVPVARPGASSIPLEGNVGIYDDVAHALLVLNPSASAIWERCDGASTFGDIVEDLAREHSVDGADIRGDVWHTIRQLARLGLVSDQAD